MITEIMTCYHCNANGNDTDLFEVASGEFVCRDCLSSFYEQCEHCGKYSYFDNMFTYNGDYYCEDCRDDLFVSCERCGDDYLADGLEYVEGYRYLCEHCREYLDSNVIQGYSHTQFYPNNDDNFYSEFGENTKQFFGIELEIGGNGERYDCAKAIRNLNPAFFILKSDSSIPGEGFEIVSKPATYKYHYNHYWDDVCRLSREHGFKSHNIRNCGLHIHISRDFFSNDKEALVKLWEIFHNNQTWLERFSRRNMDDLNNWAKFKDKYDVDYLKDNGYENHSGRYQAINNNPSHTIEFRLFRGTLKYNTFIATLQFTKYICDYVNTHSLSDCEKLILSQADFSEYSELVQYINERF